MLAAFLLLLRSVALICGGHRAVALENLALRQQLRVFKRTIPRPPIHRRDRLFSVLLTHAWDDWRTALVIVRPDTIVRWHRQWLRRRWTRRSTPTRLGRPGTTAAIRTLVAQMRGANPLWGAPRIHGELQKLGVDVSERTVSRPAQRTCRDDGQAFSGPVLVIWAVHARPDRAIVAAGERDCDGCARAIRTVVGSRRSRMERRATFGEGQRSPWRLRLQRFDLPHRDVMTHEHHLVRIPRRKHVA